MISNETNQRKREFLSRTFWGPLPESRILFHISKLSVEIDNFSADCEGLLRALQLPRALSNTFSPSSLNIVRDSVSHTVVRLCPALNRGWQWDEITLLPIGVV